jgi:Transcriptional regulator/sugar kinase
MRKHEDVSVNEISQATGLSKMTVHKIIDYYIHTGIIILTGKGESTEEGGKKPNLFAFNPNCRYIYAIRIGDKFLTITMANLRGELIAERNQTVLNGTSFQETMQHIRNDFDRINKLHDLDPKNCLAVVVGCNGIIDIKNGVCLAQYQHPDWGANLPIRDALAKLFPQEIPIHVDSWWRHMALAEIQGDNRNTKSRKRFFLIGNSDDYISGGLVSEGKVMAGSTGFAGEIGHMIIHPESHEKCVCGGTGCLQTLVAPSKMEKKARERKNEFPDSAIFRNGGEKPTLADIATAANQGDPLACELLNQAADFFALAINNIVQICDPGLVVIFGDYARAGDFFLDRLRQRINSLTMVGIDKKTTIEYTNTLAYGIGVIGAANMMTDALFTASN